MRHLGKLIGILLLLTACEGTVNQSSVPRSPVHLEINTKLEFTDFVPSNLYSYITVNQNGYKENGKFKKNVTMTDAWGYGGVVVYISDAGYVAFDLACPYCASRGMNSPCDVDGISAVCPTCGEEYELWSGYAFPRKGISREAMRRIEVFHSGDIISVRQ